MKEHYTSARFIPRFFSFVLQKLLWMPSRIFLHIFCHLTFYGSDTYKQLPKGVIFAANHTNIFDFIFVPLHIGFFSRRHPIHYTGKAPHLFPRKTWLSYVFVNKFTFYLTSTHIAHRGLKNYSISLKEHVEVIKEGNDMVIFPNGAIDIDENQFPKGGISYLVGKTKAPVVPVYIKGAFKVRLRDVLMRKVKISIYYGEPLYYEDLFADLESYNEFDRYKIVARKIMDEILLLPHKNTQKIGINLLS